jgi:hypothetical protein
VQPYIEGMWTGRSSIIRFVASIACDMADVICWCLIRSTSPGSPSHTHYIVRLQGARIDFTRQPESLEGTSSPPASPRRTVERADQLQ